MVPKWSQLQNICVIFAENYRIMEVISAREFRSNQTNVLKRVKNGGNVIITSRVGSFKIVPVTEDDHVISKDLTANLIEALNEVRQIEKGELKSRSAYDFLNEL